MKPENVTQDKQSASNYDYMHIHTLLETSSGVRHKTTWLLKLRDVFHPANELFDQSWQTVMVGQGFSYLMGPKKTLFRTYNGYS
jgi:hypothetical protein